MSADRPQPDYRAMTDNLQDVADAFRQLGAAASRASGGCDKLVIADHPDLDDLNRTLDNLYPDA